MGQLLTLTESEMREQMNMTKQDTRNEDVLTKAALKKRGWTGSLIERFLDKPNTQEPQPPHQSSRPKLYSTTRVEAAERTLRWKVARLEAHRELDRQSDSYMLATMMMPEGTEPPVTLIAAIEQSLEDPGYKAACAQYEKQSDASHRATADSTLGTLIQRYYSHSATMGTAIPRSRKNQTTSSPCYYNSHDDDIDCDDDHKPAFCALLDEGLRKRGLYLERIGDPNCKGGPQCKCAARAVPLL